MSRMKRHSLSSTSTRSFVNILKNKFEKSSELVPELVDDVVDVRRQALDYTPSLYSSIDVERMYMSSPKDVVLNNLECHSCNNETIQGPYFVLNCNHIYHVQCLCQSFTSDNENIDESLLHKQCPVCDEQIDIDELQLIHNKMLNKTKQLINLQKTHITKLETQINLITDELNACHLYKEKVDKECEKSLQIINFYKNYNNKH